MRSRTHVPLLVIVVAGLVVGCSASNSPPVESPLASIAVGDVCPPIDVRTPNGESLDLGGLWHSQHDGTYFLSQHESCLFWLGQSAADAEAAQGANWTNVFSGQILPGLVVVGPWSDVPAHPDIPANSGQLELSIGFFTQDGAEWPMLQLRQQEPAGVYGDLRWQPEATLSDVATYVGTLGVEHLDCPWLEVDGDRYELAGYIGIEGNHVFGGRESGPAVEIGEQARVEARIGQALGSGGCAPSAMMVLGLEPAR